MKRFHSLLGKSIFSRIFVINVVAVLICMVLLGSMQFVLVTNYISVKSEETLGKNAESIVNLIQSNIGMENLQNILRGFARSSQNHILIIDAKGSVLINTVEGGHTKEVPAFLGQEHTKEVLSGKRNSMIGTMGGIFKETMYTLQVPIQEPRGQVLGAVFVSIPVPEQQAMRRDFFRILWVSTLAVLVVSFLLSYMLARLLSSPIHSIRNSVKAFARGDLTARVGKEATQSGISEISDLAVNFNEMAFELEKVEEIRNSFISDVSHELRTPMTTISGFVNGILDDTIPPEHQKEYLTIVYDEVTRLSRLVNNFLDISRLEADRAVLKKTHFNINETIRLTIIGLAQRLEEKEIKVNLNFEKESCYVYADMDSIKRVVTNLLDNAVKFTPACGEISVSVLSKQQDVIIKIKNTGDGIPESQRQMIFERLYKVDKSRSTNREGNGIGLYLVKSILKAHGKHIQVNSVEGEYAEFVFSLDKGKSLAKREESVSREED